MESVKELIELDSFIYKLEVIKDKLRDEQFIYINEQEEYKVKEEEYDLDVNFVKKRLERFKLNNTVYQDYEIMKKNIEIKISEIKESIRKSCLNL